MTGACCSSSQRAPETLHLPQLHLYRSATRLFHVCYIFSSSISYMFTAACCGCVSSSKSQSLLCRSSRSVPQRSNTLILSCTLHANPSESCHDTTHFASSEGFATDCILYLTFFCRLKLCALWSLELSYLVLTLCSLALFKIIHCIDSQL